MYKRQVLTGKDKGKRGKVKNVLSSGKLIVEGINLVKKHQKPVPALKDVYKRQGVPVA